MILRRPLSKRNIIHVNLKFSSSDITKSETKEVKLILICFI